MAGIRSKSHKRGCAARSQFVGLLFGQAMALAFVFGGKQAFAAHMNLPAIAMPERSHMRFSLAEMADEVREGLGEAAVEGGKKLLNSFTNPLSY